VGTWMGPDLEICRPSPRSPPPGQRVGSKPVRGLRACRLKSLRSSRVRHVAGRICLKAKTASITNCLTVRRHYPIFALMKVLTIRLEEELHKAFKIKCVTEGVDMNAVITKMIEGYVKGSKTKAK
jgi:hypothetical protein